MYFYLLFDIYPIILFIIRYNRAEIIQNLRWKIGPVLPQEILEKLNYLEVEYFKNHSAAIESYMSEMDLDLTVVSGAFHPKLFVPMSFLLCFYFTILLIKDSNNFQDMIPPKDPYIRVRVLDDIGEVCLGDHSICLTKQSLHFIRRTDAEPFVSQVYIINLISYLFILHSILTSLFLLALGFDGGVS